MKKLQKIRNKAQKLADHGETQVWLLASPAEAEQLAHGHVPVDIERQAKKALVAIMELIANGR